MLSGKCTMRRFLLVLLVAGSSVTLLNLSTVSRKNTPPNDVRFSEVPTTTVTAENDGTLRRAFAPTLTDAQRKTLMKTVHVLVDALDAANVSYHMCGGTLLGSFLHHGLIPWDDDVDLCVADKDQPRIRKALRSTAPDYTWIEPKDQHRWKFFSILPNTTVSIATANITWRAPFIDICLCGQDRTRFWDLSNKVAKRFPLSHVFPLGRRPFSGMVLRAPRNTRAYLSRNYSFSQCKSSWWSHLREVETGTVRSVECSKLWSMYPFVFRQQLPSEQRVLETLEIGNRILSSIEVDRWGSL